MADSDLMYLPLRELAARVKSRAVSPVKLTEICLNRLETLGPKLNAVVTVMRESAMREARAAEADIAKGHHKGVLHGIPYGVKDLLATNGVPTTWGAEPYRDQVFDHDATDIEARKRCARREGRSRNPPRQPARRIDRAHDLGAAKREWPTCGCFQREVRIAAHDASCRTSAELFAIDARV